MKKLLILPIALLTLAACSKAEITAVNTLGSGPVIIEEFSDLQCPACGAISPQVTRFAEANPELVTMSYYHFPLSQHQYAFVSAEASECAADQGKFWEFVDMVFAEQSKLNEDFLYSVADSLKLNRDTFDECMSSHRHRAKILSHSREGKLRGVSGTPSIYVNGELVKWPGDEAFESYVKGLGTKD